MASFKPSRQTTASNFEWQARFWACRLSKAFHMRFLIPMLTVAAASMAAAAPQALEEPHLKVTPRTAEEAARIAKVTAPATE